MELFIRVVNGQPFEHPILGDNFRAAFPDVDVNNLPPEFARFERVVAPKLRPYETVHPDDPTYELVDGVYKDVWHKRDMTPEEIAAKQQETKDEWAVRPNAENFTAWVFDKVHCCFRAPTPCPNDGKNYFWQGTTSSWVETPQYPDDGKRYTLDFASAAWVEVTQP